MSHRATLHRTRKAAAALVIAVAAFGLTACQEGGTNASPSSSASAAAGSGVSAGAGTAQPSTATPKTNHNTAHRTPSGTAKKPDGRCTNQINYAGDPRSNAEINTIGEKTGYCPPVQHR
ncbi:MULTISPECIES: hypothetical protein [Streptomyces]|uniref:hypothetical protein n=1 Tax=Streptomyces TaxID=1883 RepID=UPI0019659FEA|nr:MULTISPECIES: hypothetical protein [Streptomyces]QRX90085.1 hypothetical protein JNO44_03695 [Streptomyces noursei]UJB40018.1 hypothetical protein HRD51_03135 [Streptomyces sp. A1-5]